MGFLPTEQVKCKIDIDRIRALFIGLPKVGKTTLLAGFPNTILLATEKGYTKHRFFPLNIVCWKPDGRKYKKDDDGVQECSFVEAVDEIVAGKHNFKTVAIDTIDMLVVLCIDYVNTYFKVKHISDVGYAKGYDMLKKELNDQLNRLFMLPYGLILTSHVRSKDIIQGNVTTQKITSSLNNQAREVIHPKISTIGHIKAKLIKTGDNKFENARVITFKQTQLEEVGDRDGVFPDELVLPNDNPEDIYKTIKACFDRANLKAESNK